MVISVELRGRHGRRISASGEDFLQGLLAMAQWAERRGLTVVSFCLMNNHLHLVLEVDDPSSALEALRRFRQAHARRAEPRGLARLAQPHLEVLSDDHAVLRYTAYAHANPRRAGMVTDPAAWPFSSHRDLLGLRTAPWYSPQSLWLRADAVAEPLGEWMHRKALGSGPVPSPATVPEQPWRRRWTLPAIEAAEPHGLPQWSLPDIARAVSAVHGVREAELYSGRQGAAARRTLVGSARHLGWHPAAVCRAVGWTRRHLRRVAADPRVEGCPIGAVLTHLEDMRLSVPRAGWLTVPIEGRGARLWSQPEIRLIGTPG